MCFVTLSETLLYVAMSLLYIVPVRLAARYEWNANAHDDLTPKGYMNQIRCPRYVTACAHK